MRRPTQPALHKPGAWTHPYTGIAAHAVFYNDGGGTPPAKPPVPATFTAPPAQPATPPAPAPNQAPAADASELLVSQDQLSALAAKEKAQGERAGARKALEKFAADNGFSNVEDAQTFINAARQAQQDALTEQERAQQQLAADKARIEQERTALENAKRTLAREQTLIRLGALDVLDDTGNVTAPNLQDALALLERELRDTPDAEPADITAAATRVKTRHPSLFGTTPTPAPQLLPPAPAGAPATGLRPGTAAHKPGDAGREMLRRRGKLRDTAA
ncbi:hypothetical protein [Streptomyces cinereoruber]|uniref:hypothetical protein n=1 Tax=Streptomyces cinereoruber TaxID=67260 RepID=UPI0036338516